MGKKNVYNEFFPFCGDAEFFWDAHRGLMH